MYVGVVPLDAGAAPPHPGHRAHQVYKPVPGDNNNFSIHLQYPSYTPDPGISPEVDEGVDAGVAHGYQQEHGVDVAEYVTGKKQIQIR